MSLSSLIFFDCIKTFFLFSKNLKTENGSSFERKKKLWYEKNHSSPEDIDYFLDKNTSSFKTYKIYIQIDLLKLLKLCGF